MSFSERTRSKSSHLSPMLSILAFTLQRGADDATAVFMPHFPAFLTISDAPFTGSTDSRSSG